MSEETLVNEEHIDANEQNNDRDDPALSDEGFFSNKVIRRNMFLLVFMDVVWMAGGSDIGIALSPLLVYLNASNTIIGIIQGATFASMIGLFASPWISRRFKYKKWYMVAATTPAVFMLALLGGGVVLSSHFGMSNNTLVTFILVVMLANYFLGGFASLPHQEYVAGCIPSSHRGRLAGLSSSLGSSAAVATSLVCAWILKRYAAPMSFGYIFLFTYVLFQGAYLLAIFAKERPVPVEKSPKAWSKAMLKGFMDDKAFARFVVISAFAWLTVGGASGFVAVYGFRELGMRPEAAAIISIIGQLVRIPSTAVVGFLSDKIGAKRLLPYWPLGVFASFLPVIFFPHALSIYLAIGIWCLAGAIYNTLYLVFMYNLPKPENRSGDMTILMLAQNIMAPIGLIIAGRMCDIFPYRTVFAGAAVLALVMIWLVKWMISTLEPFHPAKSAGEELL
ncbi:MAG: MFS transporter [Armatimonadota bacterium]